MKEILEHVKQTIVQKQILWAYPIVLKLQQNHYSLAIQWVIECIQIYSSEIKSDNFSKLNKYIQQVIDLQNVLTTLQCNEISRELWYDPQREEIQTAIARLWWSIGSFKIAQERDGIIQAVMAVELLLPDISNYRLLNRYLEAAIGISEKYQSPPNT
ncbi:MAG: hypothetical protein AAF915_21595 [Cyanobacteria bacterium P01_D01_bin.50]